MNISSLLVEAIPSVSPTINTTITPNIDEGNTIRKLCEYVLKNGVSFETKVREKEIENPIFSFLFVDKNEGGYRYYEWYKTCLSLGFVNIEQRNILEDALRSYWRSVLPGSLLLSPKDANHLFGLYARNTGSKDDIKGTRQWIMARTHSLCHIAAIGTDYVNSLMRNYQLNGDNLSIFKKILITIYVFNDVFLNGTTSSMAGKYTQLLPDAQSIPVSVFQCMKQHLRAIFRAAYTTVAQGESMQSNRDKLTRMLPLWLERGYTDEAGKNFILEGMMLDSHVVDPAMQFMPPLNATVPVDLVVSVAQSLSIQQGPLPPVHSSSFSGMPPALNSTPPMVDPTTVGHPLVPVVIPGSLSQQQQAALQGVLSTILPTVTVAPPVATLSKYPNLDLMITSVGTMANAVRLANKTGHLRYSAMDVSLVAQMVPPHVEPGRLDARVSDFYKRLDSLSSNSSP